MRSHVILHWSSATLNENEGAHNSASLDIPKLIAGRRSPVLGVNVPHPRACCDCHKSPGADTARGGRGPGLLESQETSILSRNGAGLGTRGSSRSVPAQTILWSHEIPQSRSWLTALEEFCISWWSWGWDFIFFQVFFYLLVNESRKDFCHFTMGKETDCTVASAFILIPANTTLQILECNARKKKEKCS